MVNLLSQYQKSSLIKAEILSSLLNESLHLESRHRLQFSHSLLALLHGTQNVSVTPSEVVCSSLNTCVAINLLVDVSSVALHMLVQSVHDRVSSIECGLNLFSQRCSLGDTEKIKPGLFVFFLEEAV
jgi:hypothetical protein